MRKLSKLALTISFIGSVFTTSAALAEAPVLVEMFGRNSCTYDDVVQEKLLDILMERDDLIVLNCRNTFSGVGDLKFTHSFCNDRAERYTNLLNAYGLQAPMIVVNGRWNAAIQDVLPAINLGKTDEIARITVEQDAAHGLLNIEIPDIGQTTKKGKLLVYAFVPTQGKERIFVDPDLELTQEIREKIKSGQSVPFVTKRRVSQFFMRPIVARAEIATWHGGAMNISYPLDELNRLAGDVEKDLSYVVVLHQGHDVGSVLAAGEVMSVAEVRNMMVSTEAVSIEQVSVPLFQQDL